MNIGFDLDRIFIDTPPFIPDWIIDRIYKKKDNGVLLYRIPGTIEQKIRQISHLSYFRPAMRENIQLLMKLAASKNNTIFLISGRFGFLQHQTEKIMKRHGLAHLFKQSYFNTHNEQPHIFKSRIIKEKNIDTFIDDDLSLLKYLAKKNISTHFYWLNDKIQTMIEKNLSGITELQQILPYANK